ncbi:MAG: hypothetical protein WEE89_22695 [Gemmatimonadota bacterium]
MLLVTLLAIQIQGQTDRVMIALANELEKPNAVAVVINHLDSHSTDVIVLRVDATPEHLAAALASYRKLRSEQRDGRSIIHAISGVPFQTPGQRRTAEMVLTRLRGTPLRDVVGVGRVQAAEVPFVNGTIVYVE